VILYRCLAWNERAAPDTPDGALWFPRPYQGEGRHDNPDAYGCLYLSEAPLSCIVEQLARFRGQRLVPALLQRRGLPLALAELELMDGAELVDLDEPAVLRRERLRPSRVATRERDVTQPQARALFEGHRRAAGLRWWSTFESLWANVTLFDRAASALDLGSVRKLELADEELLSAADVLGLRLA
jgi:RES domain-containing protein